MALPTFSQIGLPLLQYAKDGKSHSLLDAEKKLVKEFSLSQEEAKQEKKSGKERLFLHRTRWVRTALKYARLVVDPKKGYYKITERGLKVLKSKPSAITEKYLSQFPEYVIWRRKKQQKQKKSQIKKYFSKRYTPKNKSKEALDIEIKKIEKEASKKLKSLTQKEIEQLLDNFRTKISSSKTKTSKSKIYDRDPKLAELMKAKNNYLCQLCERTTFQGKDGHNYTESHHIIPRSNNGPDVPENILIVCPTCHRIFDSGSETAQIHAYKIMKKKKLFSEFEKLMNTKTISKKMYSKIVKS